MSHKLRFNSTFDEMNGPCPDLSALFLKLPGQVLKSLEKNEFGKKLVRNFGKMLMNLDFRGLRF